MIKKLSFLIFSVVMLLPTVCVHAQEVIVKTGGDAWKKTYRAEDTKINDLVNTKLDVRFDYDKTYMYGKEWLTVHPHFYPTDSLTLDAKGMNINEVSLFVNGKKTPLSYTYDSSFLRITLDRTYKYTENYTVYIDYVSKPNEWHAQGSAAITDAKGLYFINPKGEKKDEPIQIWTQGETEANSVWMPTIDKPNQKTTEEISMTVPDKYVTLSNGLLKSQKKNADGTRTDTWKMDLPHSPYLFFMGVGDYAIIKDSYKGKEVAYYVEKEYAPVARKIFGNTPEMIKFYSTILGIDYPWAKYDQIVGREYVSGAMENTTATLHQESAQQNARELKDGNAWESTIAHELFHQWFGDLVTAESWSNITVNESFANYSETLWAQYKYGKDAGDEQNYNDMNDYLRSGSEDLNLVRFYYEDKEDVFDNVSYPKGGRILNMLRNYVGDSAFFKSLNKYLTDNKFKNGEAQQLRLAFESVTGRDLNWYWNQWYYGSGHPHFDINYKYDDAAGKATVTVKQTQNTGKIFTMPVAIDVYNGASKTRYNVWIKNKVDTFTFNYTTRPTLINFDGDKVLLCEKNDNKTAANFQSQMQYAPLYVDRREALQYFADNGMTEDLSLGLSDSYAGLRKFTLDRLAEDSSVLSNAGILARVAALVNTEKDNKTKAAALELLSFTENDEYRNLYEKYINDSSYSVSGAALEGLAGIDKDYAYAIAKKLSGDAKGKLRDAINSVILEKGDVSDFDNILKSYADMPTSQTKLEFTSTFCGFLAKLNDAEKIKQGIDEVISFRNEIPEKYRSFTDPELQQYLQSAIEGKDNSLQSYIDEAFK